MRRILLSNVAIDAATTRRALSSPSVAPTLYSTMRHPAGSSALRGRRAGTSHRHSTLCRVTPLINGVQRRWLEYWTFGVTGRTQPFAQGEALQKIDNMKYVVNEASAPGARLTGNNCNIAYTADNIFSVAGYSEAERQHFRPLRGLDKHRIDPVDQESGKRVSDLLVQLLSQPDTNNPSMPRLRPLWWDQLLKDFPSLKTPCTAAFRTEWEVFFANAAQVAHDDVAVQAMAEPFLKRMMQEKYICYAMVWRITERLADAVDQMPQHSKIIGAEAPIEVSRHEKRITRVVLERITKLMLDTMTEQPWAHSDTTNPLFVDISQFRAWHEAGNW